MVPGRTWRWTRRATQLATLAVILVGPLLGGWQRLERSDMLRLIEERPGIAIGMLQTVSRRVRDLTDRLVV